MKRCQKCQTTKSFAEFNRWHRRDGYQPLCRECQHLYYEKTKERYRASRSATRERAKQETRSHLMKFLQEKECVDCGLTDWRVLEFDHLEGYEKEYSINRMVTGGLRWGRVLQEIAKCDVVCANCHRIRTYQRCGSYRVLEQNLASLA